MSNDLAEQLEMVTLDKLVAEQRAESLQDDLDRQKDKVLALESELVLLKSSVRNASMLEVSEGICLIQLLLSSHFRQIKPQKSPRAMK